MKFLRCLAAILALLLLCSCGAGPAPEELAADFREGLVNSTDARFTAVLYADYGDYVCEFELGFEHSGSSSLVTVIKPETLAGLTASVEDGSAVLNFGGIELTTGKLYNGGVTPVEALPAMFESWLGGYISEAYTETLDSTECLRISYTAEGGAEHRLWCSTDTLTPVYAEIIVGGMTVLRCKIREFTLS